MRRKPTVKEIGPRPLLPDEQARLEPLWSELRVQPLLQLAVPMVSWKIRTGSMERSLLANSH